MHKGTEEGLTSLDLICFEVGKKTEIPLDPPEPGLLILPNAEHNTMTHGTHGSAVQTQSG